MNKKELRKKRAEAEKKYQELKKRDIFPHQIIYKNYMKVDKLTAQTVFQKVLNNERLTEQEYKIYAENLTKEQVKLEFEKIKEKLKLDVIEL